MTALVHLADACRVVGPHDARYAPCGALIETLSSLPHAEIVSRLELASAVLAEVTCPECREMATSLGTAFSRGRRNHTIPWAAGAESTRTLRVVEELGDDGAWRPFLLTSWLAEPDGEFSVTLRVRTLKVGP